MAQDKFSGEYEILPDDYVERDEDGSVVWAGPAADVTDPDVADWMEEAGYFDEDELEETVATGELYEEE